MSLTNVLLRSVNTLAERNILIKDLREGIISMIIMSMYIGHYIIHFYLNKTGSSYHEVRNQFLHEASRYLLFEIHYWESIS